MSALPHTTPRRVVVAGGGVAAMESIMALRELGEDRLHVTLVRRPTTSSWSGP